MGPLAGTLPRAAAVLVCFGGLLVAARVVVAGDPRRSPAAAVGIVGVRHGGVSGGMCCVSGVRLEHAAEPWDRGGFAGAHGAPLGAVLVLGLLTAAALRLAHVLPVARQAAGTDLRIDPQPDAGERRTAAIGRLGEALVCAELGKLGWPLLSNVVLACGAWSVEIDHLVRASDGIIVIETKTLSGVVRGEPDAEWRFQHTRSGVSRFLNPLVQNNVMAAVRAVIPDPEVALRGSVVSAGRARFEASIVGCVVSLHDLVMVLRGNVVVPFSGEPAIATAWAALVAEAERSERQRSAHVAYVRSCKRVRPTCV